MRVKWEPTSTKCAGQHTGAAHGRTCLTGAIAGRALVHKRDSWGTAVSALKVQCTFLIAPRHKLAMLCLLVLASTGPEHDLSIRC